MKIKNSFVLRKIAGNTVALPVSDDIDLNMVITLNDTAAFLWEHLKNDTSKEELVSLLLREYDVDEKTAEKSVSSFIQTLREKGFLV